LAGLLGAGVSGLPAEGRSYPPPARAEPEHPRRRQAALAITALISAANITSLVLLAHALIRHGSPNGRQLIGAGALIWLTT
jgi:hypothetical protein